MACDDNSCSLSCHAGIGGSGSCASCNGKCSGGCEFCSTQCGDGCKGGCKNTCDSTCSGQCQGCGSACRENCTFSCTGHCDSCGGSCSSNCTFSCEDSCDGCTGDCTNTCNNGCTGANVTNLYTNLILQHIIYADDLIGLRDLVANEVTRRNSSVTDVDFQVREIAYVDTINTIINNLNKVSPTASQLKQQYDIMDAESMNALINIAKELYEENIVS